MFLPRIILSVIFCYLFTANCCFVPQLNRGTTFFSGSSTNRIFGKDKKAEFAKYARTRKEPFVFTTTIPAAKSLTVKEYYSPEVHLAPIFVGGIVGTHFNNIKNNVKITETPTEGNIIIVNNVQIEANLNPCLNFWNNYIGAFLFSYASYNAVYELAEITPEQLYEYLTGEESKPEPEEPEETKIKRTIIFRGIVFDLKPGEIIIKSSNTSGAQMGSSVTFLNRNGQAVASANVKMTYHTMIKTASGSPKIQKGFTAVIYK